MAYPEHINGFVEEMNVEKNNFFITTKDYNKFFYTIKCKCGNSHFKVSMNNTPIVKAQCIDCTESILIYDLIHYPAATMCNRYEDFEEIVINNCKIFEVCVLYEYSDEFDISDDEFDGNDLTWCQVFVKSKFDGTVTRILNDETA